MSKKPKANVMRDALYIDDENALTQTDTGSRHSIRARPAVIEQAQQRALGNTFLVPYNNRQIADDETITWEDLTQAEPGENRASMSSMPVIDAARDSAPVRAFDLLRTRLRQTTLKHGWRNIAITAPTSGCGTTFTSVNLALSLSRVPGSRTILMDMNMRNPGIADAFDIEANGRLRDYLDGTTPMGDHLVQVGETLALGLNGEVEENPAETLQDPATGLTLDRMRAALRPELVIYDMPALLAHDDVSGFLPRLDGILLVSDGTQTMARQLHECERILNGQVPLLGVVLNRARKDGIPSYN